jgi:hypothetical protein
MPVIVADRRRFWIISLPGAMLAFLYEQVGDVISHGIGPSDPKLVHVGLIDLVERDKVRGVRPSSVIHPGHVILLGSGEASRQTDRKPRKRSPSEQ